MAYRRIIGSLAVAVLVVSTAASFSFASGPVYLPVFLRTHATPYWQEVGTGSASGGGISSNSGNSEVPSLAIAPDGTPYVAWEDWSSGNGEVYVRRWDGSAWQEVGAGSASGGGISNSAEDAYFPRVAVAPDGMPHVVWADDSNGNEEIYVRRWDGSVWQEIGAGSANGGGISNNSGRSWYPGIVTAADGSVYVVWYDQSSGSNQVYVLRWDGDTWQSVGEGSATGSGISSSIGNSFEPSVAIAPDGMPYVIWRDNSVGNYEIYMRRWDGAVWSEVGPGSASGGGISNNDSLSVSCAMAIAPDGNPYAAWRDGESNNDIFVRRWEGSAWQEIGTGSASGGGISNNSGDSGSPSVAIASDGTPYIAWHDDDSGNDEIYILSWDGAAWRTVGGDSASGGGISRTADVSWRASLAIAPDGTPYLAWCDRTSGNLEIYVKRYAR